MAQDPRNPKTPKIKTDFRKPTKFQADMVKKLEKLSKNKKAKNRANKPKVSKTPSASSITKILRKMGPRGKAAAALLAGVGIGAGGNALLNKKSKTKKAPAAKPTVKKSTRKAGPSGPSMTSMRAPSTGPKPRNKNVTRRPKRPSKQGSFGRQMRASRGMGIVNPKKIKAGGKAKGYKKGGTVKDACYKKVKASYKVFPSAYASGAIAKCRKKKAGK